MAAAAAYPNLSQNYNWAAAAAYPQQWTTVGGTTQDQQVTINPQTGAADYSKQWSDYYRSLGMVREAEMIEQNILKNQAQMGAVSVATPTVADPQSNVAQVNGAVATGGAVQTDYSAQWAEYYRSIGKVKEAEAIEAQIKQKNDAAAMSQATAASATTPAVPGTDPSSVAYQQAYAAYYQNQYGYNAFAYMNQQQQPTGVAETNAAAAVNNVATENVK